MRESSSWWRSVPFFSVLLCLNASSSSWWQSAFIPLSFSARTLYHHPGGNPHLYLCLFLLERFIIIPVAIRIYTSVLFCSNASSSSWWQSAFIPLSFSARTLYHYPGGNPHLYLCPFLCERCIIILVEIHTYTSVLLCSNALSSSWWQSALNTSVLRCSNA